MFLKTKCKAALFTYEKVVRLVSEEHNHPPTFQNRTVDNLFSQNVTIVRESSCLEMMNRINYFR